MQSRPRNGAALALFGDDNLKEPEPLSAAWVPMRMDGAGRSQQAVASMQSNGRLALLLPDAGPGYDPEGDRRGMEVARIDCARSIFGVPDDHLLSDIA